jgi:hypothetical protein
MQTQPDIYGMDTAKKHIGFVGPTYCATATSVIQTPDRHRYLYLLIVFPHRPGISEEPCLFISSEITDGGHQPVLGVFDADGHKILQNEEGDWTDFDAFTRRAVEIASERLVANFVEHQHSKWKYKTVSSTSDETLNAPIAEGWSVACPSDILDGKKWFLLKKPKSTTPIAA